MTSLEDKFLKIFNKKGYEEKIARLEKEKQLEQKWLEKMEHYEKAQTNALKEMEIYKEQYGSNLEKEDLFELIFKNEEVSAVFYNFYVLKDTYYNSVWIDHVVHNYEYNVLTTFEFNRKPTIKQIYREYVKLTPKTIDNLIKDKNFSYITSNESFSIESLKYILTTHKSNLSEYDISSLIDHISRNGQFNLSTLIENSDILNIEIIAKQNYNLDLETVTYLLENKYEVDNILQEIKGITLDFVKKYEENINIYSLSINEHIDKDIVNYLIKNHSDDIDWVTLSHNHNILTEIETKDGLKHQVPLHHLINNF
jgi:antitoxin component HigA of HigAB toxin-antitoxin module